MIEISAILKALSDSTRLRLFAVLYNQEINVNEIVRIMGMGQSRISRHLKILVDAGILQSRRDGLWVFYRKSDDEKIAAFLETIYAQARNEEQIKGDLQRSKDILKQKRQQEKEFFNELAGNWESLKKDLLGDFDLNAAIVESMVNTGSVADIGCGTGDLLEAIIGQVDTAIGIDSSPAMLQVARSRLSDFPAADLRLGEAEHLPLSDGEAEGAVLNMVLHHLSDPLIVIRETFRGLKPGGRLIISEFDRHSDESLRARYADRWLGFRTAELVQFIKKAGFTVINKHFHKIKNNLRVQIIISEKIGMEA